MKKRLIVSTHIAINLQFRTRQMQDKALLHIIVFPAILPTKHKVRWNNKTALQRQQTCTSASSSPCSSVTNFTYAVHSDSL